MKMCPRWHSQLVAEPRVTLRTLSQPSTIFLQKSPWTAGLCFHALSLTSSHTNCHHSSCNLVASVDILHPTNLYPSSYSYALFSRNWASSHSGWEKHWQSRCIRTMGNYYDYWLLSTPAMCTGLLYFVWSYLGLTKICKSLNKAGRDAWIYPRTCDWLEGHWNFHEK